MLAQVLFVLLFQHALAQTTAFDSQLFSQCYAYGATCPPVTTSCASYLCAQCVEFGDPSFSSCCAAADPPSCFSTGLDSGSDSSADTNYSVCQTAVLAVSECNDASPSFSVLPATAQAACLCYISSTWAPDSFDLPWSSCIAYASTSDTADYSIVIAKAGFCSKVGNVLSKPAAAPATTTKAGAASSTTPTTRNTSTPTSTTSTNSVPKSTSESGSTTSPGTSGSSSSTSSTPKPNGSESLVKAGMIETNIILIIIAIAFTVFM